MNVPTPTDDDFDARMAKLEQTPLFMRELPEDTDDPTIAAIQSLLYEGTPDEVAQNFKEQGNEAFKERRWRDALAFYAQGIAAKPTDASLLEALLCNSAASNLELQNYGSALKSCAAALAKNLKCTKAWYRSAVALNALERFEEAVDVCNRCLAYDPNNASITICLQKAMKGWELQKVKISEKQERLRRHREKEKALADALQKRSLTKSLASSSTSEAPPIEIDDENPDALILPVFLLYPQHATSDLISTFHEDTTFADHLAQMFPPLGAYTVENLTVYAASRSKRLFKIGKDKLLRDAILAPLKGTQAVPGDGLEIREGCLNFVVLPRGIEEKKWVDKFKVDRDQAQ
ncbi:TPR-like protein [Auriculariales sp. MPI-PUGE-AT-0066]|nr:TPR-like protein [Auriculariales sp. MPI-PUGE-AT-0066]